MNLRVDLILESEQRSGSIVTVKSLVRIVSILVPLIVVLLLSWQAYGVVRIKSELRSTEARWQSVEPLEKKAKELAQERQANEDQLAQLNGWRKSHIDWNAHLLQLFHSVPENIQLQNLRVSQALQVTSNKAPARVFTLELRGKAFGAEAESSVNSFKRLLSDDPAFTNDLIKVEVPLFGADTAAGAGKNDRVFEIRCGYRERLFE